MILHMPTRLETFIKSRGIKPAHLARESGYSRQHLLRIRMGRMEPTRRCIAAIAAACRRLSHENVKAADLFDLEGDER
jgi:predicted transcriptional regulator